MNKKRKFEYNNDNDNVQGRPAQKQKHTHNIDDVVEGARDETAKRPLVYDNMIIDEQTDSARKEMNANKGNGNLNELTAAFQGMPMQ